MPTSSRIVTGNVRDLSFAEAEQVKFLFFRSALETQYGSVIIPEPIAAESDAGGDFSVSLLPGEYSGTAISETLKLNFTYSLTEDGSTNFADGIPAVSDIPITPSLVAEAAGYRDEAQAARDEAEAAQAAAELAKTGAETAKTGAETARGGAEAAQAAAVAARGGAETAELGAEAARDAALAAELGAEAARDAAEAAQAAIETNLLVYVSDDADSVTIAVSDTMIVGESTSPYPTLTLEIPTP